jgi:hypothetical protein
MARTYYDFKFELSIDGELCPSQKASPLFQLEPYPGRHRYSCVISGNRLDEYFDFLSVGRIKNISEDDARRFFLSLGQSWNPDDVRNNVNLEYFLNTVEEINFDGARLAFAGICSAVVPD